MTQPADNAVAATADGRLAAHTAEEPLLYLPRGVEIHQVDRHSEQLAQRGPLTVYLKGAEGGSVLVEVGDGLTWDMSIGITPTLKVAPMTYMVAMEDNLFFSVTLAEDTEAEAVGAWEGLLESLTAYKKSEELLADPEIVRGDFLLADGISFENQVARRIHSTSSRVAGGILMTATHISSRIAGQGEAMKARSQATQKPVQVPGVLKSAASTGKSGAKAVAKVADKAVGMLVAVPFKVAEGATRMVGKAQKNKKNDPDRPESAKRQVVTASAVGFAQVYGAMEAGAKLVLCNTRDTTAGVVGHKYGPEAAAVTKDSLNTAGHMADAYTSVRRIGVRAVARKTAKMTAKRVLLSYIGKGGDGAKKADHKLVAKDMVARQQQAILSASGKNLTTPGSATAAGSAPDSMHQTMLMHRQQSESRRQAGDLGHPATRSAATCAGQDEATYVAPAYVGA